MVIAIVTAALRHGPVVQRADGILLERKERSMPKLVSSRDDAVARLTEAFRAHGYGDATLARLQQATKLKSSSLYNYFPKGKEDMGAAALDHLEAELKERVGAVIAGAGQPAARAEAAAAALSEIYSGGAACCLFNLMTIGDARPLFANRVASIVGALIDGLAALAAEAGAPPAEARRRAEDVLVAIEGALVLSRALDDAGPFARAIEDLPRRLLD